MKSFDEWWEHTQCYDTHYQAARAAWDASLGLVLARLEEMQLRLKRAQEALERTKPS